jgi:hypothetical protein
MSYTLTKPQPLDRSRGDPPYTQHQPARRRVWLARLRVWQREPLIRFMAIGALLFLCEHLVQVHRTVASRQILIDGQLEQRITQLTRAQSGLTPSSEQLEKLVDDYIDDEVRYREALRLGLDRDDEIVRRRLIQKVTFLQHDLAAPSVPSEAVLRAFYDAHSTEFRAPLTLAFDQLYFSPDRGGWEKARVRALQTKSSSDSFPLVIPDGELSRSQAMALFGDTALIDTLFTDPVGSWSAPVRSGYGWHRVRVTHRTESEVPPFEQVRDQVEAAWREVQTQAAERRELDALRAQFQVSRAP